MKKPIGILLLGIWLSGCNGGGSSTATFFSVKDSAIPQQRQMWNGVVGYSAYNGVPMVDTVPVTISGDPISGSVLITPYRDALCTQSAPGALVADENPATIINNQAEFSNVAYTTADHLEESIYLKAEIVGENISACGPRVDVDHHFVNRKGFSIFNAEGAGAAGAAAWQKYEAANSTKVDSLNRVISVGQSMNALGGYELAIWRNNPDGTYDSTFGSGDGYVLFQGGGSGAAGALPADKSDWAVLALDDQGKYILAGSSLNMNSEEVMVLWRYLADGSLDTSFGSGAGYVVFENGGFGTAGGFSGSRHDIPNAVKVDHLGRYVVAGSSMNSSGGREMAVWRFLQDGSIDTSFGSSGYILFNHNGLGAAGGVNGAKIDTAWDLAIDTQGRYVLSGASMNVDGGIELTVWRYLPDGSLDPAFANGAGYALFNHGGMGVAGMSNETKDDAPYQNLIRVDSQQRYVIAGASLNTDNSYEMVIWRFLEDGTLDASFASGAGYAVFNHAIDGVAGATSDMKADAVSGFEIDFLGRYVIAGGSKNSSNQYEPVLWRYLDTGVLDTDFNGQGYVVFNNNSSAASGGSWDNKYEIFGSLTIDAKGRYLLGGESTNSQGGNEMVVWRYLPNGSLDR